MTPPAAGSNPGGRVEADVAVPPTQRFSKSAPCPICGGWDGQARGAGVRCFGFLSTDGAYAHCTREEHAGGLPQEGGGSFAHRLASTCRCGVSHGGAAPSPKPAGARQTRYEIRDAAGELVAVHVREDRPEGKRLWWERPDGTRGLGGLKAEALLYGAEQLAALPDGAEVVVAEGEKAADALRRRGLVAVGTVTGASGTPSDEVQRVLVRFRVRLWPDNDEPGRRHMARILERLHALGHPDVRLVAWREAPPKGDAYDFFAQGGTCEDVRRLLAAATPWTPGAAAPAADSNDPDQSAEEAPVLVSLDTVVPRAVEWVRPGRWPRAKLVLVVGDPGLGKSYLLLDAAARISTGTDWPEGGTAPHGHVLLLTAEDGLDDTITPRLLAMGADLARITALTAIKRPDRERMFALTTDLPHLTAAIERLRPVAVIIDPLSAYLGGTDSHTDADVRGLLSPLAKLAADYDTTVLALLHLNKAVQMRGLFRVGGSVAFTAAARAVFAVVPDPERPDDRRLLAPLKMNLGPMPPALAFTLTGGRLTWEAEPVGRVDLEAALRGPAVESETTEARRGVEDAERFLRELLADGPKPYRPDIVEARQAAGISERTLDRAKARLGVKSQKATFSGRWEWALPGSALEGRQPAAEECHPPALAGTLAPFGQPRADSQEFPATSPKGAKSANGGETGTLREIWRP